LADVVDDNVCDTDVNNTFYADNNPLSLVTRTISQTIKASLSLYTVLQTSGHPPLF